MRKLPGVSAVIPSFNDRKKVSRKKDSTFLGGFKITYQDNYIQVKVVGKREILDSTYYLIELPDKTKKEVSKTELFINEI